MRILGVYMKNVRSYPEATVVFPHDGVTVIYGPTGSGKTSILMSISFALFGSPGGSKSIFDAYEQPSGLDLLRAGTQNGLVRVLVNLRGKLYLVERRFRRKGDVVEFDGGLVEEYFINKETGNVELKARYSARSSDELNRKVFELIGIREKVNRASTVKATFFTSALYVPQFNIHVILEHDPEKRMDVIEKAIGLEKYKIRKINIKNIREQLGDEISRLEGAIQQITLQLSRINRDQLRRRRGEIETKIKEVESALEELKKRKEILENTEKKLSKDLESLIEKKSNLESQISKYMQVQEQMVNLVKKVKMQIASALASELDLKTVESLNSSKDKEFVERALLTVLEKLREKMNAVLVEESSLRSELAQIELTIEHLEAEERKTLEERGVLSGKLNELKQRLSDLEKELSEKRELLEKGVCPTCHQPVPHQHGYKLISDIETEISIRKSEISGIEAELEKLDSKRAELRRSIENTKKEYNSRKLQLEQITRLKNELIVYGDKLNSYMDELSRLEQEAKAIDIVRVKGELEEVIRKIEEIRRSIQSVQNEKRSLEMQLEDLAKLRGSLEGELKLIENQLREAEKLEGELSKSMIRRDNYKRLQDMLSKSEEINELIEKEVIRFLARGFKDAFSKYVRILLHDQPLEAVVTDDFGLTFKVLVGNRSYDIRSLSGGQSIALSLAYRFALNATVRAYSPHLKGSVLILDEPTTGFSRELVVRLRELLEDFGSTRLGQIIVVTHDKTLMEIGDCKIKLELDTSKLETKISYEECTYGKEGISFDEYREFIEGILMGKFRGPIRFEAAQH
ncbi:MAG: SMC family ATPase [Desulfurococcaceae archaeon]